MSSVRVIGPGRAGLSLCGALAAAGWSVEQPLGRGGDLANAAHGVDLLVIATPDRAIAEVAAAIDPVDTTVVAHLAGSLGLDVLAPHSRRAALHPLVSLPNPEIGAARLGDGAWFAVTGDPLATEVVESLRGRSFTVADGDRAAYHAAACIASNHLVALLAQAERVAPGGVPFEALLELATCTLENVKAVGTKAALTGPAARGDLETLDRHRAAMAAEEQPAYDAMAALCA
jgi:predicted short-subunit dehydrogenase-like oxidoreductase (DUF2520 family)